MFAATLARRSLLLLVVALFGLPQVARADDAADAKQVIAQQLDLIKAGDVEALKAGFTDRLKERVTKEIVEKAKATAEKMTVDDLVGGGIAVSEEGGMKSAKVKMKNGRTLTTLVWSNGKWLADTIWFK